MNRETHTRSQARFGGGDRSVLTDCGRSIRDVELARDMEPPTCRVCYAGHRAFWESERYRKLQRKGTTPAPYQEDRPEETGAVRFKQYPAAPTRSRR